MQTKIDSNSYYDYINHDKDIVHFYSESCGPCNMINDILKDYDNVLLINVDHNSDLVTELNIKCIPTVYIYKEGSLSLKIEGFKNKEEFINLINK